MCVCDLIWFTLVQYMVSCGLHGSMIVAMHMPRWCRHDSAAGSSILPIFRIQVINKKKYQQIKLIQNVQIKQIIEYNKKQSSS